MGAGIAPARVLACVAAAFLVACGGGATGGASPSPSSTPLTGPGISELGFYWTPGSTPCQAPTLINLHFKVSNAKAGAPVVVAMTGPGVPAQLNQQLPADFAINGQWPIPKGSGIWTATVVSVGGVPAVPLVPGAPLEQKSSAQC